MVNERSQSHSFLHADGDSFFVACEISLQPELKGLPVIVGEDRGIAVAMSQEAKRLGVTRGMPIFKIRRRFPQVVILSHHFKLYREISQKVYAILLSYFERVEEYSIDECFAVVRPSDIRHAGSEEALLAAVQDEIYAATGVTYSLGLARTKALAKTASKLKKPRGRVVLLSEDDERRALEASPIDDVWGIGWRTVPKFQQLGMKTAWDFAQYSPEYIQKYFSEPVFVLQRELSGQAIYQVHDNTDPRDQKSIQSTCTFRPASADPKVIWAEIAENAEAACEHARKLRLVSNSVSFFVKNREFRHRFADAKLPLYTADPGTVLNEIEGAFAKFLVPGDRIRSTGVILHNLRREEDVQRDLFGRQEGALARLAVEKAADAIRAKFGRGALKRASSMKGSGKETDSSFA